MNAAIESVGTVFGTEIFFGHYEPDNAPENNARPAQNFVLCRDEKGNATAVYGDEVWDFNPYRPSAKRISKIRFNAVFNVGSQEPQALRNDAKHLLYCIIYFGGGGRIGQVSHSTINHYWRILRRAMLFCYSQTKKPLVGVLSLEQLFTVPIYLSAFIREQVTGFDKGVLSGMLLKLVRVGEERLGYKVLNPYEFELKNPEYRQTPIIPTRIYLNAINVLGDLLNQAYQGVGAYEFFIACFADPNYGMSFAHQKGQKLGGRKNFRPSILQAINDHALDEVFTGEFSCDSKRKVQVALLKIQYVAKTVIHLYTGMRDQEVTRMPYNCLRQEAVRDQLMDDQGVVRDQSKIVTVLSTTTKYSGYKEGGAWFAPEEVVKAVEVLRSICRGLAKLYLVELDGRCSLFLNPTIVGYSRRLDEVGAPTFKKTKLLMLKALTINPEDLIELAQSDPSRDFYSEQEFAVGQPWPFASHQFRRSLAFYGSSSGFISLPSLRAQYKHMTLQMARYYTNNFDRLRTIFGYYDDRKNEFALPSNHFAFEFQMAMPMSVANQLIVDLLFSEEPLFGGTGSYAQKQKQRLQDGEINIFDARTDTEQRVKDGAISYRPTLLGGCTKVGRCNSFLLGDYAECLSCEGAIIKPEKLKVAIEQAIEELSFYDEGTGEYQVVDDDIKRMSAFKARLIDTVEL
ncbi:integrase [Pseudomonas sp. TNT2022 ID233]|uniref:integrase n=1 Tax=Pseudomonas aphyarum TaxID=2942629 RepID=UPI00235F7CDA|nr:integrase [Pseudomonas aphyarum]MDD1141004.1 integrase [Pseudomonas aphyarum]